MIAVHLLWNNLSPGKHRMGKSAGKVDMGESAPCSKIGLAHVRNGGVLPMKAGRRYRARVSAILCAGQGWGKLLVRPILLALPRRVSTPVESLLYIQAAA